MKSSRNPFQGRPAIRVLATSMLLATLAGCMTGPASHTNLIEPAVALNAGQADPAFQQPYIDVDEWRDTPLRHRYVHGGFHGTDTRFSFYYPEATSYKGRFFQHVTPAPDSENLAQRAWKGEEDKLGFALTTGAYHVETNGGGSGKTALSDSDATITAYRANAAAAQFSRIVAMKTYPGKKRPFGYLYGGSGGGYRTIGSIENTTGVWDGAVPYVIGSTMALPNVFTVRLHAMRILWDKFPQINDALDVGGSGDPYAGLDSEQAAALREVTRMGFPAQSWFGYKSMGVHGFAAVYPGVLSADPAYFKEFWTTPGYLGAAAPASLMKARLMQQARITTLLDSKTARELGIVQSQADGGVDNAFLAGQDVGLVGIKLDRRIAAPNFLGGDLFVTSGAVKGSRLQLRELKGDIAVFGIVDKSVVEKLAAGDEVRVDNSDFLAAQTYHRHQVPGPEFHAWDQFRNPDGTPIYPQRQSLVAPAFVKGTAGALPTGQIKSKVIAVASLWDREAFPWQADWYRQEVTQHLGARTDDNFRLWFSERALHGDVMAQEYPTMTISYIGMLQQALLDVSNWVENGVAPPQSTAYSVDEAQVAVPAKASDRHGIQPTVDLTANGKASATVRPGEPVKLIAQIEVPNGAGQLIEARWDIGTGTYPDSAALPGRTSNQITVSKTYEFTQPGTYFPTIRVASQRDGDHATPYTRAQNLARVRVIVK
ncbi:hypothetical protein VDG09_15240 [Xanthomonas campestris pv. raphani]|uniref:hypothetical protein n=1 Tax=Xanthomonas campestris TaxID=339 RepID=UPI002B236E7E|nr:hypothetical protein [Xanthomonas campestris]MEA9828995.1 hypothetical protein [Xanthomonas campestris pv. raphani]